MGPIAHTALASRTVHPSYQCYNNICPLVGDNYVPNKSSASAHKFYEGTVSASI